MAGCNARRKGEGHGLRCQSVTALRGRIRPDLSGFTSDIAAFYAYWAGKRRGSALPARADIDPLEMVALLPGIVLIDVVADARQFVYRLVGTREVAMRGRDPTGKS
ncbi:MAG: PAS domain-containing protein, partial [Rhodospirillaceae bacterium]|nr:PAS domain-containing protein [Rhodospirillaceae bacterium]